MTLLLYPKIKMWTCKRVQSFTATSMSKPTLNSKRPNITWHLLRLVMIWLNTWIQSVALSSAATSCDTSLISLTRPSKKTRIGASHLLLSSSLRSFTCCKPFCALSSAVAWLQTIFWPKKTCMQSKEWENRCRFFSLSTVPTLKILMTYLTVKKFRSPSVNWRKSLKRQLWYSLTLSLQ